MGIFMGNLEGGNCNWRESDKEFNGWSTSCGRKYIFDEGTPTDNNFKFCPFCGGEIKAHTREAFP